jgi:hypothetical protein
MTLLNKKDMPCQKSATAKQTSLIWGQIAKENLENTGSFWIGTADF